MKNRDSTSSPLRSAPALTAIWCIAWLRLSGAPAAPLQQSWTEWTAESKSVPQPTAAVFYVTLEKLLEGKDVALVMYYREGGIYGGGRFYHGYALVPGRDNMPHALDLTPTPPFQFVWRAGPKEGSALSHADVTFLARRYNYKDKRFDKLIGAWRRHAFLRGTAGVVAPGAETGASSLSLAYSWSAWAYVNQITIWSASIRSPVRSFGGTRMCEDSTPRQRRSS